MKKNERIRIKCKLACVTLHYTSQYDKLIPKHNALQYCIPIKQRHRIEERSRLERALVVAALRHQPVHQQHAPPGEIGISAKTTKNFITLQFPFGKCERMLIIEHSSL